MSNQDYTEQHSMPPWHEQQPDLLTRLRRLSREITSAADEAI
jgi:hypothetical protein